LGNAQVGSPCGAYEAGGDVQQLIAQLLWLGQRVFAVKQEHFGPGEQVDAGQGEFQPGLVDREEAGRYLGPSSACP
jgi:hypothetical protein